MVGIAARGIVVRVLRGNETKPARHPQQIGNADGAPRVVGLLPFVHRRRRPQVIRAFLDELAHERRGDALAHRPARQPRGVVEPALVALRDDASLVRNHERSGECFSRIEGCFNTLGHFRGNDLARKRRIGEPVSHRPRLRCRIG
jgi:hypothetical protein